MLRAGGVDDRDAGAHVPLVDAPLGDLLGVGEVDAVVDAVREVGVADRVRRDDPAGRAHRGQHVGQVELALGVVGVDRRERGDQRAAVERVDAGVDLADRELLGGRVAGRLGLDHAQDRAVAVADHAAVGRRARRAPSSPSSPPRRAASCASTRALIASAVSSATSPLMTTTVAVGIEQRRRGRDGVAGARAAPPGWRPRRRPADAPPAAASGCRPRSPAPAPASRAACTGHAISGRPQSGCRTLGTAERMRVPSPAARITTVGSGTRAS